jgi:hypothetical protein
MAARSPPPQPGRLFFSLFPGFQSKLKDAVILLSNTLPFVGYGMDGVH